MFNANALAVRQALFEVSGEIRGFKPDQNPHRRGV